MHISDDFHVRQGLSIWLFLILSLGNALTSNWYLNVCCHIVSALHGNAKKNLLVFVILETFTTARRANTVFVTDCNWNELVFQVSAFENCLRPARWTFVFALLT